MKYTYFVFIKFIALTAISCSLKSQPQDDVYNFKFDEEVNMSTSKNSWNISGNAKHTILLDTIEFNEGNASAKIEVFKGVKAKENLSVYQLLKIPFNTTDFEISFWFKIKNLTEGKLNVVILDSQEQVI